MSDSLGSRAWAWTHQSELDRELADGADPAQSGALQTRAHQLLGGRLRRGLLAELDVVLAKAEHPPHWHSVSQPVQALEVQAARASLEMLRAALQQPAAGCVRGIALAACLINDHSGPLYHGHDATAITQLAQAATMALRANA